MCQPKICVHCCCPPFSQICHLPIPFIPRVQELIHSSVQSMCRGVHDEPHVRRSICLCEVKIDSAAAFGSMEHSAVRADLIRYYHPSLLTHQVLSTLYGLWPNMDSNHDQTMCAGRLSLSSSLQRGCRQRHPACAGSFHT